MKLGEYVNNVHTYVNRVIKPALSFIEQLPVNDYCLAQPAVVLPGVERLFSTPLSGEAGNRGIRLELRQCPYTNRRFVSCGFYVGDDKEPFFMQELICEEDVLDDFFLLLNRVEEKLSAGQ